MGLFRINEAFAKNGIGAGMTAEDIAKKHSVPLEKIEDQIEKGMKVELEHTSDLDKARQVAIDHLVEFPDYYDRLQKMEDQAKAEEVKLTEEFSEFLSREVDYLKAEFFSTISESELLSDSAIRAWADWKLTKLNLRTVNESFVNSFLEEVHGDRSRVAVMSKKDKIHEIMDAFESMPRGLKEELKSMDDVRGKKRERVISSALKSLKK
jgi:hypothetical protein